MNKEDLEAGMIVFLRPTTKTAPRECFLHLPARVVSTEFWPRVDVTVEEGTEIERRLVLHHSNIGLKPKKAANQDKKEGDTQQGHGAAVSNRKLVAFTAVPPLELPDGMEEQTLW